MPDEPNGFIIATLCCLPFWWLVWHLIYHHRPTISAPVAGIAIMAALLLILWGYNRTLRR